MGTQSFDVFVANEIEVTRGGKKETRTAWRTVGRPWPGKIDGAIGFELFLFPGQKYLLNMGERKGQFRSPFEKFNDLGGEHA
jgi:hypothetical protein